MDTHGNVNQKTWSVYTYIAVILSLLGTIRSDNFNQNYFLTWGSDHARILNDGQTVQLTLDKNSGSGFGSKNTYLFGSTSMNIKLVPGNSAGTVTTFYMTSDSSKPFHDEIDFEFLGNLNGTSYILQTNVFTHGIGYREQRIKLWFDPTADFHNYSILWNHKLILLTVDSIPIRVFKNNEAAGIPYPTRQPMSILASLWNGEGWATAGGKVRTDWSKAPFIAAYRGFEVNACIANSAVTPRCATASPHNLWDQPHLQTLNRHQLRELKWVRKKHMIYDYCKVGKKAGKRPPECALNP